MTNDEELKLIIAHKPPLYKVPCDWQIVTRDSTETGFFIHDDSEIMQDNNHDILSEFGYLIHVAKKIKDMPHIKRIRIVQYRKVVSSLPFDEIVTNNIGHKVLSVDIFKKYDLNKITNPNENSFLLSSCIDLKKVMILSANTIWNNILTQYSVTHSTDDILAFVVDAIRCGEITNEEANIFLNYDKFFIGGIGIGVFPSKIFIKIMQKIETIVNYHYKHSWVKREGKYEMHNMAFCIERLSSFLLIKEIFNLKLDYKKFIGHTAILSNDGNYDPKKAL